MLRLGEGQVTSLTPVLGEGGGMSHYLRRGIGGGGGMSHYLRPGMVGWGHVSLPKPGYMGEVGACHITYAGV